ncbi:hypothetical protein [Facilibium subflavum]|uniref:hypothetical protein n=1 Tax=Facilibium subflavum TaxID=2219058 RepID=UPI000E653F2F|nr:hypothetical protein [Facilibium subflavum]
MKKYISILFLGFAMISSVAFSSTTDDTNNKPEEAQACKADSYDCQGNWDLFKKGVIDASTATKNAAVDAGKKVSDYSQKAWDKTKAASKEGWEDTKRFVNETKQNIQQHFSDDSTQENQEKSSQGSEK